MRLSSLCTFIIPLLLIGACNKKQGEGEAAGPHSASTNASSRPHGGPPEAAISACHGKTLGDTCTAKMGDREETGTCEAAPPGARSSELACRPARGPQGGPPPPAP
jgi:hypothetical protein